MAKTEVHHHKRSLIDVGNTVPSNLKFGIIVAVVIFWSQFIRTLMESVFSFLGVSGPILADFIIAVAVTILGYLVLLSYRKIRFRLKKIKV